MNHFNLSEIKINVTNYFELFTLVTAIICFIFVESFINKWMFLFLGLTVIVEFFAKLLKASKIPNAFLYNIFEPIKIMFFVSLLYYALPVTLLKRSYLVAVLVFYFLFMLLNIIFWQGFYTYNSYTVSIGTLFIVYSAIIFVWQLINGEKSNSQIMQPVSWIVLGTFIFFIGSFSYVQFVNYIIAHISKNDGKYYRMIYDSLNIIMYTFFIIALLIDLKYKKNAIV